MITLNERLSLLQETVLFGGLGEAALHALGELFTERRLESGQTLFYEGTMGEACYVVVSGRLQVTKQKDALREVVIDERLPNAVVGEIALFGGQQRMATIRAIEPTVLLELSRESWRAVTEQYPVISERVIATLLRYVTHLSDRLTELEAQLLGGGDLIEVKVGAQLGHYHITDVLGKGGNATVYRASDNNEKGREVALKVLAHELSEQPGFLDRFRREAILVSDLHHPQILPVYGFGERGGVTYIVMRLVTGGTLEQRLSRPISLTQSTQYLFQIGAALQYAHERDVIHLDIKPRNVMMENDDTCYLADFGLAKLIRRSAEPSASQAQGIISGTPGYLAPEQAKAERPTAASDIYSLGVVLFEMVTGFLPFEGRNLTDVLLGHIMKPVPPISARFPEVPVAAEAVIYKAMAKKPEDRFATVQDMLSAWRDAVGDKVKLAPEPPKSRPWDQLFKKKL